MAINSYGYPNTIAPGSHFARYTAAAGHNWNFLTESALKVSKNPSGTRNVNITAGWAQVAGIMVNNTGTITMQAPESAGSSQWHCLVLRLWEADGLGGYQSALHWVSGTSSQAIPALTQVWETQFDIPIALARTTSTDAQVTHLVDLRIVANSGGGAHIYDNMILDLVQTWYGAIFYNVNTDTTYMIARKSSDSMADYKRLLTDQDGRKVLLDNSPGSAASGWGQDGNWTQVRSILDARVVQLQVVMRRWGGGDIIAAPTGGMPDSPIYTVKDIYRPYDQVTGAGYYYSAGRATYGCMCTLDAGSGVVTLRSGSPNVDLPQINAPEWDGFPSIRVTFTYLSRD